MTGPPPHPLPSFKIEETLLDGGTRIIEVRGELDLATAPTLGQRIRRPLFWEGAERVLVDLTDVVFIDSSGASALLLSVSHARALGLGLGVVCPEGDVMRRLRTYGLDSMLSVYPTRQQALDEMGAQATP